MQIVIDIPKKTYNEIKERTIVTCGEIFAKNLVRRIRNGTPLPKGHGDLIDVNVLKNNIHYVPIAPIFQGDYVTYRNVIFADILDMLPTIIEGSEDNACLDEGNTR